MVARGKDESLDSQNCRGRAGRPPKIGNLVGRLNRTTPNAQDKCRPVSLGRHQRRDFKPFGRLTSACGCCLLRTSHVAPSLPVLSVFRVRCCSHSLMKDTLGMTATFEAIPGMGHSCADVVSSVVAGVVLFKINNWGVVHDCILWAGSAKIPQCVTLRWWTPELKNSTRCIDDVLRVRTAYYCSSNLHLLA